MSDKADHFLSRYLWSVLNKNAILDLNKVPDTATVVSGVNFPGLRWIKIFVVVFTIEKEMPRWIYKAVHFLSGYLWFIFKFKSAFSAENEMKL